MASYYNFIHNFKKKKIVIPNNCIFLFKKAKLIFYAVERSCLTLSFRTDIAIQLIVREIILAMHDPELILHTSFKTR